MLNLDRGPVRNVDRYKAKSEEDYIKHDIVYFEKLFDYVEDRLSREQNASVREKYLWLQKKIEKQIRYMPHVEKYFDEKKDLKFEEEKNKLKKALHEENS